MVAAPCLACAADPPLPGHVSHPPPPPPPPVPLLHHPVSSRPEALHLLNARCRTPRHVAQAHAHLLRRGLGRDPAILAVILRRYASLGGAHHRAAAAAFSELPPPPSAFAWNVMLRALTLAGSPHDALRLFYNRMAAAGVPPDKFTFPFAVKACAACRDLRKGMEVHARAIKAGLCNDVFLQNTLMHLYLRCEGGEALYGHLMFSRMRSRNMVSWTTLVSGLAARGNLDSARALFEAMPVRRSVVTWTAMVDAYARNGRPEEALEMFRRMQVENVRPNEFTVVASLIACTALGSAKLGRWIHDYARRNGWSEDDVYVGTALIDMYSKCGSLAEAEEVFDRMPERSTATWNSMITGLGVHGRAQEAIDLFGTMGRAGVRPDATTFRAVLCACARAGRASRGVELFRDMKERYGILPTAEHYSCMSEILDQAGAPDGRPEPTEKLRELPGTGTDGASGASREDQDHGAGGELFMGDDEQVMWEVG